MIERKGVAMKCPSCGAEIAEGHMYCDTCGEEIRIVPDFEPELEHHIVEALSTLAEEFEDGPKQELMDDEEVDISYEIEPFYKRKKVIISFVSLVAILILSGIIVFNLYRTYSVDFQMQQAQKYASAHNYEEAVNYLYKAFVLDSENADYLFTIAGYYYEYEETEKTIKVLEDIINSLVFEEDVKEKAYGMLITIYDKQEAYQTISDLLEECEQQGIVTQFQYYLAMEPEFSYVGGTYDKIIPLKLSANTTGNIYYTLDGTVPNKSSNIYTAPIFLETGEYVISAYFINEYGIESEVVRHKYHISLSMPDAPEILLYSGVYTEPTYIEVVLPESGQIYYTTDGTDPTSDSMKYSSPIPMPLGKSLFKFAVISEEGIVGSVLSRNYELNLATDVSIDIAISNVINSLVDQHVLLDAEGHTQGMNGRYVYKFHSIIKVGELGYHYQIYEYYEDPTGNQTQSERLYAVDIHSGVPNRLIYNEAGEMGLIPL